MNSLQYYKDRYREIAENLNYRGDSAELLIQLLANASYIEEVENISYMEEASLENAVLMNSKIQRCMEMMYSVYRGTCPRVIMRFRPTKERFQAEPFQEISTSSNFKVYYLGYLDPNYIEGTEDGYDAGFIMSQCDYPAGTDQIATIIGFISPAVFEYKGEDGCFKISDYRDQVYINSPRLSTLDNLSNDVLVKIRHTGESSSNIGVTRDFSDHILNNKLFDLTTTNFGSRLYFKNVLDTNDSVEVTYFSMCSLSDFQENELKKISLRNADFQPFSEEFIGARGLSNYLQNPTNSMFVIPGDPRESSAEVHYNANKYRFTNSIVRSNTDLGRLLEEDCPKVVKGGTVWVFNESGYTTLYYIPADEAKLLTSTEKDEFRKKRKAYYITDSLNIVKATKLSVVLAFDIVLYKPSSNLEEEIRKLVDTYKNKFGIDFSGFSDNSSDLKSEMIATISKIPEVRSVKDIRVSLAEKAGSIGSLDDIDEESASHIYYDISYTINTRVD